MTSAYKPQYIKAIFGLEKMANLYVGFRCDILTESKNECRWSKNEE